MSKDRYSSPEKSFLQTKGEPVSAGTYLLDTGTLLMENKRIQILVEKFIDGRATSEEEADLMDWYRASNEQEIEWPTADAGEKERLRLKMLAIIQDKTFRRKRKVLYRSRIAAAAAVLVCLSVGGYFLMHRQPDVSEKITRNLTETIHPGTNGAILTLSGGKKVILGQKQKGTIATQGQSALQKQNDSLLVYEESRDAVGKSANEVSYNTLEIPRGHHFQVVLPDGTKVWLNAASSLTYPTAFTGKTRTVELKGEAYFEVVHRKDQPFRVATSSQVVDVIGTHFDIKAYSEDSVVKTTLLEGAVKVTSLNTKQDRLLRPGEQAIVGLQKMRVKKVDPRAVVGWKNGQFIFRSTPVKQIMQEVARWYDVKIVYESDVSGESVWGSVSRYANVSEVLDMIALTGVVHFRIKGKTIIVTK